MILIAPPPRFWLRHGKACRSFLAYTQLTLFSRRRGLADSFVRGESRGFGIQNVRGGGERDLKSKTGLILNVLPPPAVK